MRKRNYTVLSDCCLKSNTSSSELQTSIEVSFETVSDQQEETFNPDTSMKQGAKVVPFSVF